MNKIIISIVAMICLTTTAYAGSLQPHTFAGQVVKVADGDTITVLDSQNQQIKIRLYGIDCPEKKQAFGQKAKQFTLSTVSSKTVDIEAIDIDRYGRTVGIVQINGTTLNEELLRNGYAWLYEQYCKKGFCGEWNRIEQQARSSKIGLWSDPHAMEPWEFRKK